MPNIVNRNSQFFSNLVNILPMQGVVGRSHPLTTKEAKVLMEIWESETDQQGNKLIPITSDAKCIESLIEKGVLLNSSKRAISLYPVGNRVAFTDRGKNLIKTIILHTEKSAFEKQSSDWSADDVWGNKIKTASVNLPRNWLERAMKTWN